MHPVDNRRIGYISNGRLEECLQMKIHSQLTDIYIVFKSFEPCNQLSSVEHITLHRNKWIRYPSQWIEVVSYRLRMKSLYVIGLDSRKQTS